MFKKLLVLSGVTLLYLFLGAEVHGQQMWFANRFRLKMLDERLRLTLNTQLRLENRLRDYDRAFVEPRIAWKFGDVAKLRFNYRYSDRSTTFGAEEQPQDDEYRLSGDLFLYYEIDDSDWELQTRFRFQHEREVDETDYDQVIRGRLKGTYDLTNKSDIYASAELFYPVNDDDAWQLDGWRITTGLESELSDKVLLTTFYRMERNRDDRLWQTAYILGIYLEYDFELD